MSATSSWLLLIMLLQPPSSSLSSMEGDRMTHAKQQMEWAVENGVTGKFVIEEGSFGIGLTASEPIAAGDVILSVPKRLALCDQAAKATFDASSLTRLRQAISDAGSELDSTLVLSIMLERHKGPSSFWYPFLRMLPAEPCPVHQATLEEVDAVLTGTPMHALMQGVVESWRVAKEIILEHEPSFRNESAASGFSYTAADVDWAASMSVVRGYGGALFGAPGNSKCLIPIAEIANHRPSPTAPNWSLVNQNQHGYIAKTDIAKGEEIFVNYGVLPGEKTLHTWNFNTGEELPQSAATIIPEMVVTMTAEGQGGEFLELKRSLLEGLGLIQDGESAGTTEERLVDSFLEKSLLPCARIVALQQDSIGMLDLSIFRGDSAGEAVEKGWAALGEQISGPITYENEISALALLASLLSARKQDGSGKTAGEYEEDLAKLPTQKHPRPLVRDVLVKLGAVESVFNEKALAFLSGQYQMITELHAAMEQNDQSDQENKQDL